MIAIVSALVLCASLLPPSSAAGRGSAPSPVTTASAACLVNTARAAPFVVPDPAEELAAFGAALDAKEWERATELVAALQTRLDALREGIESTPPPAAAELKASRAEQAQILAALERAAKQTRATVALHAKVLAAGVRAGAEGEKFVVRALEWKHITEAEQPLAAALGALGARPEPKRIALYEEYLNDLRIPVARAAIVAMGNFFGEKDAVRKKIVERLVRAYDGTGMGGETAGRQRNDPKNALGQPGDRMAVRHDFQFQLARLTGGIHHNTSNDWVAWFGANEKTKWRDGIDKPEIKLDGLKSGPAPKPGGH